MDCNRAHRLLGQWLLAGVVLFAWESSLLYARSASRQVYNPTTQKMEPEKRARRLATWTPSDHQPHQRSQSQSQAKKQVKEVAEQPGEEFYEEDFDSAVIKASYEGQPYYEAGSTFESCNDCCVGCGDLCCNDTCCGDVCCGNNMSFSPGQHVYVGFEATIIKPRFENNAAFTTMTSDGTTFETYSQTDLDYNMEFTPRVILGWERSDGIGLRATWWKFDYSSANVSANPPANGFGEISSPFPELDITTNIPTDTYRAQSDLDAYAIDLEATRQASLGCWQLGLGGGIRYAFTEQNYRAEIRETGNVLRDAMVFRHSLEGIGPTISFEAYRPWTPQIGSFVKARGSLLFGDGSSNLTAGEDLDLANSFTTRRITERDDVFSISEIQLGVRWHAQQFRGRVLTPFVTTAMEGQLWQGAGNATSEEGNLGFFGLNVGTGFIW